MDIGIIIVFAFFILMLWFMNRSQKKMAAKASERRDEALQIGNTVATASGMIGTVVDIDGGVVTLESPSGDETQWLTTAVSSVIEPPYESAYTIEDDSDDESAPELGSSDETDGISPRKSDLES